MNSDARLPAGVWLYANRLPAGLTDVEMQDFLAERGIGLTLDRISVRNYEDAGGSNAKISISNEVVESLVNWVINSDKIRGTHKVAANLPSTAFGPRE